MLFLGKEITGVKGKLIASIEVKCGGHLIHDTFHSNTHHIPNISPSKVNHFQIHGDEIIKVGDKKAKLPFYEIFFLLVQNTIYSYNMSY